MPEKSIFPMYGNLALYTMKNESIQVVPKYFSNSISVLDSLKVNRDYETNQFYLQRNDSLLYEVPFKTTLQLIAKLLSDTLNKPVELTTKQFYTEFTPLYAVSSDSVYKQMLKVSDNFIAEQLMLQVGKATKNSYNTDDAINYSLKNYLTKHTSQTKMG